MRNVTLLAILLSVSACSTIAEMSPKARLDAANRLYATTADTERAAARACYDHPTPGCGDAARAAKKVDEVAYAALDKANAAWLANGTSLDIDVGAAVGAVDGFHALFSENKP